MGTPLYMRSVVDRNVVMRRIPAFQFFLFYCFTTLLVNNLFYQIHEHLLLHDT